MVIIACKSFFGNQLALQTSKAYAWIVSSSFLAQLGRLRLGTMVSNVSSKELQDSTKA